MSAAKHRWVETSSISRAIVEHRWSPRTECALPILIRYRESWWMECTITNFSKNGLCLDTGPMQLSKGAVVDIVTDSDSSNEQHESLIAMVIHSSKGRAGLWLGDDPEQYEQLRTFIENA